MNILFKGKLRVLCRKIVDLDDFQVNLVVVGNEKDCGFCWLDRMTDLDKEIVDFFFRFGDGLGVEVVG